MPIFEAILFVLYVIFGTILHISVALQGDGNITLSQPWYMWLFLLVVVAMIGVLVRGVGRRGP